MRGWNLTHNSVSCVGLLGVWGFRFFFFFFLGGGGLELSGVFGVWGVWGVRGCLDYGVWEGLDFKVSKFKVWGLELFAYA